MTHVSTNFWIFGKNDQKCTWLGRWDESVFSSSSWPQRVTIKIIKTSSSWIRLADICTWTFLLSAFVDESSLIIQVSRIVREADFFIKAAEWSAFRTHWIFIFLNEEHRSYVIRIELKAFYLCGKNWLMFCRYE